MTKKELQELNRALANINYLRDSNIRSIDQVMQAPLVIPLVCDRGVEYAKGYYQGRLEGLTAAYMEIYRRFLPNIPKK